MKWIPALFLTLVSFLSLGQSIDRLSDFENKTNLFLSDCVVDGFVNYEKVYNDQNGLIELIEIIGDIDISSFNEEQIKSFYINSYNLLVIHEVIKNYPTTSVKDIPGFFDRKKFNVAGNSITLNTLEKDYLLKKYKDSRIHFVLVCGAKDCPKLWDRGYTSDGIEAEMVQRSKSVLNDSIFVKVTDQEVKLSEIFKWNRFEFGGKKDVVKYINSFRNILLDPKKKVSYYTYDWTLNDVRFLDSNASEAGANSFRYVTSAAIPKGGIEVKLFNNLYSQVEGPGDASDRRSTYFTSSLSFLYGYSKRLNVGIAARYRRVLNSRLPSSSFDVFDALSSPDGRQRISAFGPQIRWAPVDSWTNFSIQSQLTFPVGGQLSGSENAPFLDWAGPVFWTQFFNDKTIGDQFSLFTEIDLLIEEIGGAGKANRVSTPMTVILSYFPVKNVTLYGLVGYSPFIVSPYDYFTQVGLGAKFQISPDFEIELLATDFSNRFLNSINGNASTLNIGFRYSR